MRIIGNCLKIALMLLVTGIYSCHTNYLAYEEDKDGIYIPFNKDTLSYQLDVFPNFNQVPSIEVLEMFYVMGNMTNYDRTFKMELIDSMTNCEEGVAFDLNRELVMPANEVSTREHVLTWYRSAATAVDSLTVGVRIIENDNFLPTICYIFKFICKEQEIFRPSFWQDEHLGPWTPKLMYHFLDQYHALQESEPLIYRNISAYCGDFFTQWSFDVEFLVIRYIVRPLYNYYKENPDPEVMIPEPRY